MTFIASRARMYPDNIWRRDVPFLQDGIAAITMFGIGFAPISALALTLIEICSLPLGTLILVVPAFVTAIGLSCYNPRYGRLMLHGFLMGIIAVTCYDCVRFACVAVGWLHDFIPQIGAMLVEDSKYHVSVGYLWRYLGNGGGMGLAFVSAFALIKHHLSEQFQVRLTRRVSKIIGVGFGVFVWSCLIATLCISPHGEDMMFVMSPTTLLLTLIGHVVFGYSLGWLINEFGFRRRLFLRGN